MLPGMDENAVIAPVRATPRAGDTIVTNGAAPPTPYQIVGGDGVIVQIAERFYDIMDSDPAYASLRALHARDLEPVRHGFARFLAGWMGGPRDWFDRGTCVVSLHRSFPIDRDIAGQWAEAMQRAIDGQVGLDPDIAARMGEALGHMALGMVNMERPQASARSERAMAAVAGNA